METESEFVEVKGTLKRSQKQFVGCYKIHDVAQGAGLENMEFIGFPVKAFGGDNRYEKKTADGNDRPDHIVLDPNDNDKFICFVDWKGKNPCHYGDPDEKYKLNVRAYKSYLRHSKKLGIPLIIAMAFLKNKFVPGGKNEIESFEYFICHSEDIIWKTIFMEHDKNWVYVFKKKYALDFYEVEEYFKGLLLPKEKMSGKQDVYLNNLYAVDNVCYLKERNSDAPIKICSFDLNDKLLLFNRDDSDWVRDSKCYGFNESVLRLSKKCDTVRLVCPDGKFDIPIYVILENGIYLWFRHDDLTAKIYLKLETILSYPMEEKF